MLFNSTLKTQPKTKCKFCLYYCHCSSVFFLLLFLFTCNLILKDSNDHISKTQSSLRRNRSDFCKKCVLSYAVMIKCQKSSIYASRQYKSYLNMRKKYSYSHFPLTCTWVNIIQVQASNQLRSKQSQTPKPQLQYLIKC